MKKPHDTYKLWFPQPEPGTVKPCPICGSGTEVWQYADNPGAQLLRVVMCTRGDRFGPQIRESLMGGCLLYMPPQEFYQATTKEAVRFWNEYAEAVAAQRVDSDPAAWPEAHTQGGLLTVDQVSMSRPLSCRADCSMDQYSPLQVWVVTRPNSGSTSAMFNQMLKALDGKRIRISIAVHPTDFAALQQKK